MIYFVLDSGSGNVKAGWTETAPEDRLTSLQTGSDATLILLGHGPGDRQMEQAAHALLDAYRLVGEWFSPSPALDSLFLSIARRGAMSPSPGAKTVSFSSRRPHERGAVAS